MTEQWISSVGGLEASGAPEQALDAAAAELGLGLPADYRAVMRRVNGGKATFGESAVRLWRAEDLAERNAGYEVREFAPGFTYFGSDGGGEGCAWDLRTDRKSNYVVLPFIGPDAESAVPCGNTFEEFLAVLHRGIPFERKGPRVT